jgi:hypothetical protein
MAKKSDVKRPESNNREVQNKGKAVHNHQKTSYAANLWGIAGRQEIMEMRRFWQLRIPRT